MKQALVSASYLALLALQTVWHGLVPPPHGSGNWLLVLIATIPLLLPLRGLLKGSLRSMTWAGYLSVLYLVVGIMEAWANPPQRLFAAAQIILVIVFIGSLLAFSRPTRQN